MKILTSTGYFSSGSSAVIDLLAEYQNVNASSNFEFRFLHDIDGISDLEFHLTECHNRHNSGHAVKRFYNLMKFYAGNRWRPRYSNYIDRNVLLKITDEYIHTLSRFQYKGWWFFDLYDRGLLSYYYNQFMFHLYRKTNIDLFDTLKNEVTYCPHPTKEQFISATQHYVSEFLSAIHDSETEFLELDQLLPSSNIERILKYIPEETFVFVVSRDPRDVFLLEKYILKNAPVPKDVNDFCKWYRYSSESGEGVSNNNSHIIKIRFEDLVYKYEETVSMIERTIGLRSDDHVSKFSRMNPKRSIVNTQIWKRINDPDAIRIIEKELPEYIYVFGAGNQNTVPGIECKTNNMF